jgi:hypothetical protein
LGPVFLSALSRCLKEHVVPKCMRTFTLARSLNDQPRKALAARPARDLARDNPEVIQSGGFCEVAQHDSGGEVSRPCVRDLIETGLS